MMEPSSGPPAASSLLLLPHDPARSTADGLALLLGEVGGENRDRRVVGDAVQRAGATGRSQLGAAVVGPGGEVERAGEVAGDPAPPRRQVGHLDPEAGLDE